MKPSWILLAVFVQVLSSVASAAVVIPQVLVNADTEHVDAFVFNQDRKTSNKTIVEVLKENKLMEVADLMHRTGLNLTSKKGNFTVLAPSDLALNNLPYIIREKLVTSKEFATTFIKYHVLKGRAPSTSIKTDQVNDTLLQNRTVRFNQYTVDKKSEITVNGAVLKKVDLQASNGIVHVLDRALWPQATQNNIVDAISATKSLSTFAKAIKDGGMNVTLTGDGPFTIFAPTNEACKKHGTIAQKDAKGIVQYHSVGKTLYTSGMSDKEEFETMYKYIIMRRLEIHLNDGQVSVEGRKNTAKVTVADIPVNNGVLHIIDAVLKPPKLL